MPYINSLTLSVLGAFFIVFIRETYSISSPGDIRLVGSNGTQGRVEIFHNGVWGTICDDFWDMNEGNVVCRQLGFTGAVVVYTNAAFGQGTGKIWMDNVNCHGNETKLEDCQHSGWGINNCQHSEDAGVACQNATIISKGGSCTFDNGPNNLCGYKNLPGNDFDWRLSSAGYHWQYYLPSRDHTTGYGRYIYVQGRYRGVGKKAQIISPVLNDIKCLHFYYFMKGSRVGELNVYVKTASNKSLLWQNVGPQSAVWIKAIVPIKWVSSKFTILFEAVIGGSYAADIAIDDIQVYNKPCNYNATGNCTFEPGVKCGYTEPADNAIKWNLHKGRIDYRTFGPTKDQTSGNGYFVYLKTNYRTPRGQKSQFISPEVYGGRCIQFYYYLGGSMPGELALYIDDGTKRKLMWQLVGPQGNRWQKGAVPINEDMEVFKVVFEAISGSPYNGRIALDDISILNDRCKIFPSSAVVTPIDIRNISKEIRLVGTSSDNAGRIEVFHNGRWGTICGSNFPLTSGRVVCRQLGFKDVLMVVPCCSVFGSGKGRILLQDVKCRGNERDIKMCSHRQWGMTTCYHSQDVGVICKSKHTSKDARLNGTSHTYEGRAEVKIGGVWGTISDSSWDIFDADVFCRQSGFSGASEVLNYQHRGGHGPEWIRDSNCNGREKSFWKCNYTTDLQKYHYHWHSHYRDAGAKCYDLKLTGGRTRNEGILLIRWEGTWGTICNDGWDINDAHVACRNLGFHQAKSIKVKYRVTAPSKMTSLLSQFECKGDEVSLATCTRRSLASVSHQCTHANDAIVVCDSRQVPKTTSTPSSRKTAGPTPKITSKSTTTSKVKPASTPKAKTPSPTATTVPVVLKCIKSPKYGQVCVCGQENKAKVTSNCYALGIHVNSIKIKVEKTKWSSEGFKELLAAQLTEYCSNNTCGRRRRAQYVFTNTDVIVIKYEFSSSTETRIQFIVFDSYTKSPIPSDVIRDMANHDKMLAGFELSNQIPSPHRRSTNDTKHPNIVVIIGIALGALLLGAVVIFSILYRKRKRRLHALIRYRVPDCPPELNLTDDEDDQMIEDDRLLTLNQHDEAPLLPVVA